MSKTSIIHVHLDGQVHKLEIEAGQAGSISALLEGLKKQAGVSPSATDGLFVFDDDSEDELLLDSELKPNLKRIHVHRCKRIQVTVKYVGTSKDQQFTPAAKIRKVLKWALEAFQVDMAEKFELRLGADSEPLPLDAHLSEYVPTAVCSLTLYLAPVCRIQG